MLWHSDVRARRGFYGLVAIMTNSIEAPGEREAVVRLSERQKQQRALASLGDKP